MYSRSLASLAGLDSVEVHVGGPGGWVVATWPNFLPSLRLDTELGERFASHRVEGEVQVLAAFVVPHIAHADLGVVGGIHEAAFDLKELRPVRQVLFRQARLPQMWRLDDMVVNRDHTGVSRKWHEGLSGRERRYL